jgi:hypothetical protein
MPAQHTLRHQLPRLATFKKTDFVALNTSDADSGAVGICHNGTDLYIAEIVTYGELEDPASISTDEGVLGNGISFQYSL